MKISVLFATLLLSVPAMLAQEPAKKPYFVTLSSSEVQQLKDAQEAVDKAESELRSLQDSIAQDHGASFNALRCVDDCPAGDTPSDNYLFLGKRLEVLPFDSGEPRGTYGYIDSALGEVFPQ